MAEAHQAVAFSFSVTHEGLVINYDVELLNVVWLSGVRSWKKRMQRFANNFKNGVYPSSLEFLAGILTIVLGMTYLFNIDPSYGFIHSLNNGVITPYLSFNLPPVGCEVLSCVTFSVLLWLAKAMLMRYTLKVLFCYKGWMYEFRSKSGISWRTKLWVLWVKSLTLSKPLLYSYQASLPRLPLPGVKDTIQRYLRSVRPLIIDDEKYEHTVEVANDFANGIGRKLQMYLLLKAWWSTNYVSDWWEEFVYLRGRQPLMVNSNFYGMDMFDIRNTSNQSSRAANLVHGSFLFRRLIDRQELRPILMQGIIPLCSVQYERLFNTTRIPGIETDKIYHLNDSSHIVVISRGKFYKVNTHYKGRLLLPKQLEMIFDKILDDKSEPLPGEESLGALTAQDRVTWAKARQEHFRKGVNRISLDAIERAAFVLAFDDEDMAFDPRDASKLNRYAQMLLHGRGNDRWYDKSFNIIVAHNGLAGFNAEHAWADAPIMSHYWEYLLYYDMIKLGYDENGRCAIGNKVVPPCAIRLKWELSDTVQNLIAESSVNALAIIKDVDLHILHHHEYGKGFIKKCKVSPDAYIQMALQLAYFRDVGHLSLTYEASMTRLYREGRTETVRPVTIESSAFVNAINDKSKPKEDIMKVFRHACQRHQRGYQDAMCGQGIDRHLFCLYVVSKYLEVDSPFLKEVLSEPWKLSTSQTPVGQAGLWNPKDHPDAFSAGGGFGPVADDGYGVSYIIPGDDMLFFHVSSKRCSKETDSVRFAGHIRQALADIKSLFENPK